MQTKIQNDFIACLLLLFSKGQAVAFTQGGPPACMYGLKGRVAWFSAVIKALAAKTNAYHLQGQLSTVRTFLMLHTILQQ